MENTITINCSQCGSPFSFKEGDRNARCPSCSTLLAISGESGISRYYLEERLDLPKARSEARRRLAAAGIDQRIAGSLRFERGDLYFIPFWRLRGHVFGWAWTEQETTVREEDYDENGQRVIREVRGPNERWMETISARVDCSSPACDVARFGLNGIATVSAVLPLKGMQYENLSKRGTIFDPVKTADQVRKEALAQARGGINGRNKLKQVVRLNLAAENLALISYPVWSLTFRRGERLFPVMVDGVNGRILKGRFPGRARMRLLQPLSTVMLLIYAFSVHSLAGIAAVAGFLALLAADGGLTPGGVIGHFFMLIDRDREVELG